MIASVIREAGFKEAMLGLSLSYGQTWEPDDGMGWLKGYELMLKLSNKDKGHNKFLESIMVWLDITAPRYFWSEFDTYRVGVTKQSECFDSSTDVLTKSGWVAWPDVSIDSELATLNLSSGDIEFQRATSIVHEPFCGDMVKISNGRIDLLVTPNHRMLYETNSGRLGFRPASEAMYSSVTPIPRWGAVRSGAGDDFILPALESCWHTGSRACKKVWDEMSIPLDVWLPFFGFWLAEGSCASEGGNYNIHITQIKEHSWFQEIEDMISGLPFVVHRTEHKTQHGTTSVRWTISNRQLYEYLHPLAGAKNKRIPRWYFGLSKEMKEVLYYWMFLGDGTKASGIYTTISPQLADDVQELLRHIGYSSNIRKRSSQLSANTIYTVNPSQARMMRPRREDYSIVHYEGDIHCATVPNETLYVRRNGKAMWTGNSTMHTIKRNPLTQLDFVARIKEEYLDYLNALIEDCAPIEKIKAALPEGFLQRRIVCTNYKALRTIYTQRRKHKLHEWRMFCKDLDEQLEYSSLLLGGDA